MSDRPSDVSGRPGFPGGWKNWIESTLILLGAITIFAMMFLSVTDAFMRSLLNAPIFGANDYTKIVLSVAVSISLPLCVLTGRVIAIDTLVERLPESIQRPLGWLVSLVGAAMLFYLAWRAFLNGQEAARFAETTLLLQLPLGPSYYAIAIGSGLAAVLLIAERLHHER